MSALDLGRRAAAPGNEVWMSPMVKLLIGLGSALAAGWIGHGPFGQGEAFAGRLEAQARTVVHKAALPGVGVRIARDPLSRQAILSGPADDFQREGLGQFPGLNDRVRAIPGISGVRWEEGRRMPLLAETLILVGLAWLVGLGLGWLFFGRPKREGYL